MQVFKISTIYICKAKLNFCLQRLSVFCSSVVSSKTCSRYKIFQIAPIENMLSKRFYCFAAAAALLVLGSVTLSHAATSSTGKSINPPEVSVFVDSSL
jgi:hypothetical protein